MLNEPLLKTMLNKWIFIRWWKAGEKEEEKRWKRKEEEKEKEEEEEEERWEERQRYNIKKKNRAGKFLKRQPWEGQNGKSNFNDYATATLIHSQKQSNK